MGLGVSMTILLRLMMPIYDERPPAGPGSGVRITNPLPPGSSSCHAAVYGVHVLAGPDHRNDDRRRGTTRRPRVSRPLLDLDPAGAAPGAPVQGAGGPDRPSRSRGNRDRPGREPPDRLVRMDAHAGSRRGRRA